MSFKQTLTVATLVLCLSVPAAFAAGTPGNVKSVQATVAGNEMTIIWTPVPGAVHYRIYYSHESILGHGGNYDDFEQTPDSQTVYTFKSLPLKSGTIYVGVLAVDIGGKESDGFEVEGSAQIPVTASSSSFSSSAPAVTSTSSSASSRAAMPTGENPTSTAVPMGVKSVEAISETGVLVTFSKDVNLSAVINPGFFLITNASGIVLPTIKTDITGTQVLITTAPMSAATEYVLGLLSPIAAADGTYATPSEPQVRFQTLAQGQTPPSIYGRNPNLPGALPAPTSSYQPRPVETPLDPADLGLSAVLRKDGMYNVITRWSPSANAASYALYTSKNGSPYTWNSVVEKEKTSVQYSRIPSGTFGVKVASRIRNAESQGIEKVITLPASGVGLLGVAAVAGAGAARRMQRRKKKVV